MAKSTITVLDLLDRSWGTWQPDGDTLTFQDGKIADSYNHHVGQIRVAARTQIDAQRKLVSLR
jgi:hypothetical protein